jgi:ABC-type phosphate transport system substrate-binding protein
MKRHRRVRRVATIVATCAGTTVVGALSGVSPASAALSCNNIYGMGSSLQNVAQKNVWIPGYKGFTGCTAAPTVQYTSRASGPGLEEFGNGTGVLKPAEDTGAPTGVLDGFTGTDDPPTAGQLGNASNAALEATLVELTVPVMQAPVAVDLSLPTECNLAVGARVNIQNENLDKLWLAKVPAGGEDPNNGKAAYPANTWGAFFALIGQTGVTDKGTNSGDGCQTPITLEVRSAASGTSYVFKNYLAQLDPKEWAPFASDFDFWPATTENTGNEGGKNVTQKTAEKPGRIGYANLADGAIASGTLTEPFTGKVAVVTKDGGGSHEILWAQIQNNGTSLTSPGYGSPKAASGEVANCATTKDTPSEAGAPYSVTDSWAGVLASDPNATHDLAGNFYPICGLTFDLAWKHYNAPNLQPLYTNVGLGLTVEGTEAAAKDYLTYVTSGTAGEGQSAIASNYYIGLPAPLLTKAKNAVAAMGL